MVGEVLLEIVGEAKVIATRRQVGRTGAAAEADTVDLVYPLLHKAGGERLTERRRRSALKAVQDDCDLRVGGACLHAPAPEDVHVEEVTVGGGNADAGLFEVCFEGQVRIPKEGASYCLHVLVVEEGIGRDVRGVRKELGVQIFCWFGCSGRRESKGGSKGGSGHEDSSENHDAA